MVDNLLARFDCILFDLGNTLIKQENPGIPYEDLDVELLPGVEKLLVALQGKFTLGIVSNTKVITASQIRVKLKEAGIDHFFEVVIATAELGIHKPDKQPIEIALSQLNQSAARSLYIGDNEIDLQAARAAGVAFAYTGVDIYDVIEQYSCNPDSALERAHNAALSFSATHAGAAQARFDGLVKPLGSLGRIETAVAQIAGITHAVQPVLDPVAVAVFAGDHGVAADSSVTPWPQDITLLMLDVMGQSKAAISIIAESADVYCQYINVGALADSPSSNVRNERVVSGTADLRFSDAMSKAQVLAAMEIGASAAERLIAGGSRTLCTGELGIGNTTPSAAIIAFYLKLNAAQVTGRGSGIDDETLHSKVQVIEAALANVDADSDPVELLAQIGGSEIAALAGFILRSATLRVPIILDGVITLAAALVARSLRSEISEFLIASHCSTEPAAKLALESLGLSPLLDLQLRLGEGTGAVLAVPILRAGCALLSQMAQLHEIMPSN